MQDPISHAHLCTIAFLVLLTTTAFAQEEPANQTEFAVIAQPVDISIAAKNMDVTLSFSAEKGESEISYQWYKSTDGTIETGEAIEGATGSSYTTEIFTEREIRYYYCVASADEDSVASDMAVVAYTGLPILYINTEVPIDSITKDTTIINGTDTINTNGYVFGNMQLVYVDDTPTFSYTFKKTKNGEKKEGIKGRGNTTWYDMPKKGYNIKFDKQQSLFGLPASKKWCILANYDDKTLLRNKFSSVLGKEIFNSEWNPYSYSVDVVWNGEFRGNYTLSEKNTIEDSRIDIQDISDYGSAAFTDQNGDGVIDLYDGGFILEIDERLDAPYWFFTSKEKTPVTLKEPDEVSREIQLHVNKIVLDAENSLYSDYFTDPNEGWRKYFDENSVIDWLFTNEIARNHDAPYYASIYKFYSPEDGKLHYGPIWDFDMGFGNDGENGKRPEQGITTGWYVKNGFWTARMFKDSAFVVNVINRWREKKAELDAAVAEIFPALARDDSISAECNFMKWKILGTYVWPNPVGFEKRLTYQSEVDYMKDWLEERIAWLDDAIENTFFISYDLDGGTLSKPNANPNVFLASGTKAFTLQNPTRKGYNFIGWSGTGIEGMSKNVTVTDDRKGDKAFKANWKKDISASLALIADSLMIYNGSEWTPEIVVIHDGDTLVADSDYTVTYADNVFAGTATIVITGTGEIDGVKNESFTIAPKPATLSIANTTKLYRDEDPEFTYTVEGMLAIDSVEEQLTGVVLNRAQGEDAGEYVITATIDTALNSNYAVSVVEGRLTITQRAATLAAQDISKAYGEKDPKLTYTVDGVKENIKGVTLSRKSGEELGEYAIIISFDGTANPNYVVTTVDGVFTIHPNDSKVVVTIKGHVDTVLYDGKKHTVEGFDMSSNTKGYSLNHVVYKEHATVSGIEPKTYSMGLDAKDFENTSPNYTNVVFKVTDGSLTIKEDKKNDALPALPTVANLLKVSSTDHRIQVNTAMMGERYAVIDMQGVIVSEGRVEATSFEIPVSMSGVYMVHVGAHAQLVSIK